MGSTPLFEAMCVAVRVRPMSAFDGVDRNVITSTNDLIQIWQAGKPTPLESVYDFVFGPKASQIAVFEPVRAVVEGALRGENGTCFAFGPTGSGKTHTMLGAGVEESLRSMKGDEMLWKLPTGDGALPSSWGVIPRAVHLLLSRLEQLAHNAQPSPSTVESRMAELEARARAEGYPVPPDEQQPHPPGPSRVGVQEGVHGQGREGVLSAFGLPHTAAPSILGERDTAGGEGVGASTPPLPHTRSTYTVLASYCQVYNEQAYDLLSGLEGRREGGRAYVGLRPGHAAGMTGPLRIREGRADGGNGSHERGRPHSGLDRSWRGGFQATPTAEWVSGEGFGLEDATAVHVVGLSEHSVRSVGDVLHLLGVGAGRRAVRATAQNTDSSRSHAILQLKVRIDTWSGDRIVAVKTSKLSLVDLAGSERWNAGVGGEASLASGTGSTVSTATADGGSYRRRTGRGPGSANRPIGSAAMLKPSAAATVDRARERELVAINSSLSALGNVIAGLADSSRLRRQYAASVESAHTLSLPPPPTPPRPFIPYRDSTLTRVLRDCLGGGSRTVLIATLSPAESAMEWSLATLAFASRARGVTSHVHSNASTLTSQEVLLSQAREEIGRLRKALAAAQAAVGHSMLSMPKQAQGAGAQYGRYGAQPSRHSRAVVRGEARAHAAPVPTPTPTRAQLRHSTDTRVSMGSPVRSPMGRGGAGESDVDEVLFLLRGGHPSPSSRALIVLSASPTGGRGEGHATPLRADPPTPALPPSPRGYDPTRPPRAAGARVGVGASTLPLMPHLRKGVGGGGGMASPASPPFFRGGRAGADTQAWVSPGKAKSSPAPSPVAPPAPLPPRSVSSSTTASIDLPGPPALNMFELAMMLVAEEKDGQGGESPTRALDSTSRRLQLPTGEVRFVTPTASSALAASLRQFERERGGGAGGGMELLSSLATSRLAGSFAVTRPGQSPPPPPSSGFPFTPAPSPSPPARGRGAPGRGSVVAVGSESLHSITGGMVAPHKSVPSLLHRQGTGFGPIGADAAASLRRQGQGTAFDFNANLALARGMSSKQLLGSSHGNGGSHVFGGKSPPTGHGEGEEDRLAAMKERALGSLAQAESLVRAGTVSRLPTTGVTGVVGSDAVEAQQPRERWAPASPPPGDSSLSSRIAAFLSRRRV